MAIITFNQRLGLPPDDGEPRSVVLLTLAPEPWRPASPGQDEPPPASGEPTPEPASPPAPAERGNPDGSSGPGS
jgi:hypothetical protein